MRCGCVGFRLRSRTRARPSLPRRMTTHDAASVAEAESFAARLESLAASIPPARPLEAPLVASVPFRDGTTAAHRAAVAFERLVGGEDAPRTTWYSAGKRHLHQPQLEALARLVAPMAESSDDPRDERVVLELGAGQALLGRLVSRITSAPLVAVDRRDTGDAPRSSHDDGHEDEKDDASAPAAESDPPTPKMTRVVVDLTRCAYDELLADANLAPHHLNDADAPPSTVVVAKHLCAGATDAAVRLVVDGATRRPGRAAVASVALAPCCHPQIRRDEYSGAEWLERAWRDAGNRIGADSSALGPAGFARVLALVGVTKERAGASAETLARYHGKSLGALTEICGGFPRLRRLGRIARRALEHGRAEALRAGGFPDARVCRYVDAATSPDNLVIVAGTPVVAGASSSGACSGARSGADPDATVDGVPARGVVAHVNAADAGARGSLSRRVAEYLLESRGRCLRAGDLPPMESVVAASAWRPAGEATAREKKRRQRQKCAGDARRFARRSERRDGDGHPGGDDLELDDEPVDEIAPTRDPVEESLGESTRVPAVMVGGDPSRILAFLASRGRAHVARSVGMLCPFDRHERARPGETDVASLARVADRVVRLARGDDDGGRGCDGDKNVGDSRGASGGVSEESGGRFGARARRSGAPEPVDVHAFLVRDEVDPGWRRRRPHRGRVPLVVSSGGRLGSEGLARARRRRRRDRRRRREHARDARGGDEHGRNHRKTFTVAVRLRARPRARGDGRRTRDGISARAMVRGRRGGVAGRRVPPTTRRRRRMVRGDRRGDDER